MFKLKEVNFWPTVRANQWSDLQKKSLRSNFSMVYNILEAQPPRSMANVLNPSLLFATTMTTTTDAIGQNLSSRQILFLSGTKKFQIKKVPQTFNYFWRYCQQWQQQQQPTQFFSGWNHSSWQNIFCREQKFKIIVQLFKIASLSDISITFLLL